MPHSYTAISCIAPSAPKNDIPGSITNWNATSGHIGGIARENRMKALAIGVMFDHLHALLSLPSTMSFAKAVQLIKGGSSKWIQDSMSKYRKFEWQDGYGAFSVSA